MFNWLTKYFIKPKEIIYRGQNRHPTANIVPSPSGDPGMYGWEEAPQLEPDLMDLNQEDLERYFRGKREY